MKEFFLTNQNELINIAFWGINIGIGIYLGKYLKPFIMWVKGGVENGDGKLENKELQIMIFSLTFLFMVLATTLLDVEYPIEMILGALAGAGIMYGMNSFNEKLKKNKETEEEK